MIETIDTKRKEILDKIRKVLALASNNPSEEEGQTAMLLAQKLMAENNILASDINKSETVKREVSNDLVESTTRSPWWHQALAGIIADNFKCFIYINKRKVIRKTNIKFVGLKNDVQIAKEVYWYALNVLEINSTKYVISNTIRGKSIKGMKNQYIYGFLDGLKEKFAEQIKNNSFALVLVKDPEVNKTYDDLHIKNGGKIIINCNGNEADRIQGYLDGKSFNHVSGSLTN